MIACVNAACCTTGAIPGIWRVYSVMFVYIFHISSQY